MSLSYDERKQLEEMERPIDSEDPAFARNPRSGKRESSTIAWNWPGVLWLVGGLLVLLAGISTQLPLIGMIGFLLIIIGGYQLVREPEPLGNSDEQSR